MSQVTTGVFKGKNKIIIEMEQDPVWASWVQILSVSRFLFLGNRLHSPS